MLPVLKVTGGQLPKNIDVLIGMDVIKNGDFSITSSDGKTKFSFQIPSTYNIDFEKEIQETNTQTPIVKEKEPGRNDTCSCGSGLKYKKCCGK